MKEQQKLKENKKIKEIEDIEEEFPERDEDGIDIIITSRELAD
jgi:hypothetical protein